MISIRWTFLIFLCFGIAAALALWSESYLFVDSGEFFFMELLDTKWFYHVPNRPMMNLFQIPFVLVSKLSSSLTLLKLAYASLYILSPLFLMGICFWLLRKQPSAMVWPLSAYSIGLGFFHFNSISEQVLCLMAFWPLMFLLLKSPARTKEILLTSFLSFFLIGIHPISFVLFPLLIGILCFIRPTHYRIKAICLLVLLIIRLSMIPNDPTDTAVFTLYRESNGLSASLYFIKRIPLFSVVLVAPLMLSFFIGLYQKGSKAIGLPFILLLPLIYAYSIYYLLFIHQAGIGHQVDLRFLMVLTQIPFILGHLYFFKYPSKTGHIIPKQTLAYLASFFFILQLPVHILYRHQKNLLVDYVDQYPSKCVPVNKAQMKVGIEQYFIPSIYYLTKAEIPASKMIMHQSFCHHPSIQDIGSERDPPVIYRNVLHEPTGRVFKLEKAYQAIRLDQGESL